MMILTGQSEVATEADKTLNLSNVCDAHAASLLSMTDTSLFMKLMPKLTVLNVSIRQRESCVAPALAEVIDNAAGNTVRA